ncbi:complexin isoform X11 [Drosophila erecta]|nr:complexin isoform X11 [Drosophila erecta]
MEEEREKMRQDIRDKYNIKKKEEIVEAAPQEEPNPLMRKKKTPEELAAEAEQEELDDFTSKFLLPLSNAVEPSPARGIYILQFQPTNCSAPIAPAPIL